jgi:predicted ATPase
LADLSLQKTGGNPFFLKQLLHTLYHQKMIWLDSPKLCWHWNIQEIRNAQITEDIVDLLVKKIKKIPEKTQYTLKLAAVIGFRFSLKILALLAKQDYLEVGKDLWKALQENLISPTDEKYRYVQSGFKSISGRAEFKFTHNRIQQAAYSLISSTDKLRINLEIGRLMMEKLPLEEQEKMIFKIVNHMNLGVSLVKNQSEKLNLAKLNLTAGIKSKNFVAYKASLRYFSLGIKLLGYNCWKNHYELTFHLYKNYVESLYLSGYFSKSEQIIRKMLGKLKSANDKAVFYNQLIFQYTMEAKYKEAVHLTCKALSLLKINLRVTNYREAEKKERSSIKSKLIHRSIYSLIDLPGITEKNISMGLKILSQVLPILYFIDQNLYSFAITKAINLAFRYGNIAEIAFVYVSYGVILVSKYQEYTDAFEFGQLALSLSEKFEDDTQRCKAAQNFANYIYPWKRHINGAKEINQKSFQAGLTSGQLQFLGYSRKDLVLNRYFQGDSIKDLLGDVQRYLCFSKKTDNLIATDTLNAMDLILRRINDEAMSIHSFYNSDFESENDFIQVCSKRNSWSAVCTFLIYRSQVFYLFEEYPEAFSSIQKAKGLISYMPGSIATVEYNVYESLILIQLCVNHRKNKRSYFKRMDQNQVQMRKWADNCPENFLHLYLLVQAEIARVREKESDAMKLYEQAINAARENGFTKDEALANELAAKFYLELGIRKIAILHMTEAHCKYKIWGAVCKVRELERKYQHLLPIAFEKEISLFEPGKGKCLVYALKKKKDQASVSPDVFDITTFVKTTQMLTSEISLERLLKKIMSIVLDIAGAEKGILLLKKRGKLVMEAMGIIDDPYIMLTPSTPLEELNICGMSLMLSESIVDYVVRTKKSVILHNVDN